VGIKAKTPEGLRMDNAAIAQVVVLLEETGKASRPRRPKQSTR